MRTVLRIAALAVALSGLWACDSEQPLQGGSRVATVSLNAVAQIAYYNIWETWRDTDGNGIPDARVPKNDPFLAQWRCEDSGLVTDSFVPWSYSVEVTVLRKGNVTPEIIATTQLDSRKFSSTTPYDTTATPIAPPPPVGDVHFINGVRASTASEFYLESCDGAQNLPVPNFAGHTNPATLDVPISPGDTIIVNARLALPRNNQVLQFNYPSPALEGAIRVEGLPVSLVGPSRSASEDGAGLAFSFTVN